MELVALLSTGKGTWGQVSGLIQKGEWEKVIIVGPPFAKEFTVHDAPFDFIEFDPNKPLVQLKKGFRKKTQRKIQRNRSCIINRIRQRQGTHGSPIRTSLSPRRRPLHRSNQGWRRDVIK